MKNMYLTVLFIPLWNVDVNDVIVTNMNVFIISAVQYYLTVVSWHVIESALMPCVPDFILIIDCIPPTS